MSESVPAASTLALRPDGQDEVSTRRALIFVYAAFSFRYLYPLVLVPFLARTLGVAEYGRVLAAGAVSTFVWTIAEWGLPTSGTRDAAHARTRQALSDLYGEQLTGRIVMCIPAACVGAIAALTTPILADKPSYGVVAVINGLVCAFNLGWYFQGTLAFRTAVVMEVAGNVVTLPIILWLVRSEADGLLLLGIQTVAGILATILGHSIALAPLPRPALSLRTGFQRAKETSVLFAHRGAGMAMQSLVLFEASFLVGADEVGQFGAAEKLVGLCMGAIAPAASVLTGKASRRWSEGAREGIGLARRALIFTVGLAVLGTCAVELTAELAIRIVLGDGFAEAVPLVRVLMLSVPFAAATSGIGSFVLLPLRLDRPIMVSSIITLLVLAVLVPPLSMFGGIRGTCVARLVAAAIATLAIGKAARRAVQMQAA
jgi:O-antigen/teichoic acid export membrane protein